jgi:hypothetical protein
LGVLEVTKIAGGRVETQPADPRAQVLAKGDAEPEADNGRTVGEPPTLDRWTPFVANDGRELRVSAKLQPVFELKGFSRIGFRMIRRAIVTKTEEELSPERLAILPTADILRIDLATVARGVDRLQTEREKQLSLIVPLSFTSLSSQKGRTEFVKQLKEAGAFVRLGVICEIWDIEGVPPGALLSAVSLVRPFSLLVMGRLANANPKAIARLDGTGLQALSIDCPAGLDDEAFVAWAGVLITAAKRVARSVAVYGVSSPARAGLLASLGASHVSISGG